MASAGLRDELICSICLNVYRDPVTLRCQHNFCWVCIDRVLDTQEGSGVYSCPDCRAVFQERPALQSSQSMCEETGNFCTYCIHSPVPAVKSCRHCEASLCDDHLEVHSKSEEHVLTKLSFVRSIHKKVLTNSCSDDAACICATCLSEEHQGHQVEPLNEASEEKKEKLSNVLGNLTTKRAANEKTVQSLQERRREAEEKAAGVTERVAALFRDIRRQLEVLEERVLSEISRQEEQASRSVSDLIQQLEIQKDELSREIRHIEELYNTTDPFTVLQGWKSIKDDFGETERGHNKDSKRNAVRDLDEGLISVTLHTALSDIVTCVKRAFYVQQTPDLVLNGNTASNDICVSGDLKSASGSEIHQNRPKTTERFQYNQVLSTRNFSSGQHYWEVETCETGNWRVGMAYTSIVRKGYHSLIGHSSKSWGLCRYFNLYFVIHDRKVIPVPPKPSCQRLGIYLDYGTGRLCFYELCDPIRLLYTFTTTFIEPLHVVFGVYTGWVRIRS